MLPAGTSAQNPGYTVPRPRRIAALVNISTATGFMNTGSAQVYAENPLYNWADTLSWSTGKHAFKFGVDWRLPRTTGNGSAVPDPPVILGNASATATPSPFGTATNFNTPDRSRRLSAGIAQCGPAAESPRRARM